MKNWIIVLLLAGLAFLFFQNRALILSSRFANAVNPSSGAPTAVQNSLTSPSAVTAASPAQSIETPAPTLAPREKSAYRAQLTQEKEKLLSLQTQKKQMQATTSAEVQAQQQQVNQQILDRQSAIQNLRLQLQSNQGAQVQVEQTGNQLKAAQIQNQRQNLESINQQIQNQEDQIKSTNAQIAQWNRSDQYEKADRIATLNSNLAILKNNLAEARKQKQALQEDHSLDRSQVTAAVNVEKGRIKLSEQEIHAQIEALTIEVQQLSQQKASLNSAPSRFQSQLNELDSQIKASQLIISNLQSVINARPN